MRRSLLFPCAITVAALAALSLLDSGKAPESKTEPSQPEHDWVLVYYMSYDNNLEYCGPVILDALEKGVGDSKLVVTVLSDDTDQSGLKRYTVTSRGRTIETLKSDDSASEEIVSDYLAWVTTTYPARHYAVVFLNHGGRLDEMCLDERPEENEGERWLSARRVGPILREFRENVSGEVELLFLQQCGRASIENLYNFREAAATITASQMTVGAPNTYYEETLKWLAKQPSNPPVPVVSRLSNRSEPNRWRAGCVSFRNFRPLCARPFGVRQFRRAYAHRSPVHDGGPRTNPQPNGLDLARQIMASDEHFGIYVCVDGGALADVPARIDPVIVNLLGDHSSNLNAPTGQQPCYSYESETFYDATEWLGSAFQANNRPTESFHRFEKWMGEKLVVASTVNPRFRETLGTWSGLSLWVPESEEVRGRYSDYPIYQECRLDDLWRAMYPTADLRR